MSIWDDIGSIFEAPADAVSSVVSFLQAVAWLFNPLNWLRAVELLIGTIMFGMGLHMTIRELRGAPTLGSEIRQVVRYVPGIGKLAK